MVSSSSESRGAFGRDLLQGASLPARLAARRSLTPNRQAYLRRLAVQNLQADA